VTTVGLEQVWRRCAPDVLAALVRCYGDFDAAEDAVRAHLLEMDGRFEEARAAYAIAARLATSIPEQRYLNTKAAP
jgi:predicted RNA polymerase sigma factor